MLAGLGDLKILRSLYTNVFVPFEVCKEIIEGGKTGFGIAEFQSATWLKKESSSSIINPFLLNSLDIGEASVIQLALNQSIQTVCIDEAVGRRIARLNNLSVTGSIGILLRAKQEGYPLSVKQAIANMLNHNIRLSETVIKIALKESGKNDVTSQ